jgi:hypothetical protein
MRRVSLTILRTHIPIFQIRLANHVASQQSFPEAQALGIEHPPSMVPKRHCIKKLFCLGPEIVDLGSYCINLLLLKQN